MPSEASERGGASEHHLEVTRTARYWTVGSPAARDVWIVLHGYRQLARRFLRRFGPIVEPNRLLVAPEALSRFYTSAEPGPHGPSSVVGASWMTREDRLHEIRDYVAYLDRLADTVVPSEAALTVLGFSQGAATATRWVTAGAVRARRLVLWGGFLPPDQNLEGAAHVLSHTELVLVRGRRDPVLTEELAKEERERLERAGIAYRMVPYDGGHEIEARTLRGLATP